MHAILDPLKKMKGLSPQEQREKVVQILELYDRMHDYRIPSGRLWIDDSRISPPVLAPDTKKFGYSVRRGRWFFKKLRQFFDGKEPEILARLQQRFEDEIRISREIRKKAKKSEDEFMFMAWAGHHEIPPYAYDFDGLVRPEYGMAGIVQDIKFLPVLIATGGMANIYLAEGKDGKKYALKLFHQPWKFRSDFAARRPSRKYVFKDILKNLRANKKLLSNPVFVQMLALSENDCTMSSRDPWYLMDFFEGRSVKQALKDKDEIPAAQKRTAVRTYALMLQHLHDNNFLYVDNSWGSLLFNDNEAKVCDPDFITKEGEPCILNIGTPAYMSQEQILSLDVLTRSSDVEGFALMIDELYNGEVMRTDWSYETRQKAKEEAKSDKKRYLVKRARKVPKDLRTLVHDSIQYPKDTSITIADFVSALDR